MKGRNKSLEAVSFIAFHCIPLVPLYSLNYLAGIWKPLKTGKKEKVQGTRASSLPTPCNMRKSLLNPSIIPFLYHPPKEGVRVGFQLLRGEIGDFCHRMGATEELDKDQNIKLEILQIFSKCFFFLPLLELLSVRECIPRS